MPSRLKRLLEKGDVLVPRTRIAPDGKLLTCRMPENEVPDVIPMLGRLCGQDESVQRAFFCAPEVSQMLKVPGEGGFCGYRNIQMLVSYIRGTQAIGHEYFMQRTPTIFQLQDLIERAWDMGFGSSGRVETGGIRDTRKYIGTPEASRCMFNSFPAFLLTVDRRKLSFLVWGFRESPVPHSIYYLL